MPGSSLLGVHVKASLVKYAHQKAYHKAQTLLIPPAGQVWKSYYFAGSLRIAMRVQVNGSADQVYYLLTDHLGSTTVSYRSDGLDTRTQSYKPWGELRGSGNSLPTDWTFTGQRWEEVGLYYFNARWFDASLGRFIQADTIVPALGNSQAWDRYAGLGNNPVKYIDPSGHKYCNGPKEGDCSNKPVKAYLGKYTISTYHKAHYSDFSGPWVPIPGKNGQSLKLNSKVITAPEAMLKYKNDPNGGAVGVAYAGSGITKVNGKEVEFHCENCHLPEVYWVPEGKSEVNEGAYYDLGQSKRVEPYKTVAAPPEFPIGTTLFLPKLEQDFGAKGVDGYVTVTDRGGAFPSGEPRLDLYIGVGYSATTPKWYQTYPTGTVTMDVYEVIYPND